jgi:arylamine N-acetyltransferase
MVNIVTINDTRYLVDVSFGADGPTHPIPLTSGYTNKNVSPHELLLEYRGLGQHTDPNQRVWVYSTREPSSAPADGAELTSWQERYSFIEIEFFPEDYAVMNLSTMTRPTSYFVQTVLASVFLPDEKSGRPVGVLTLHKDEVKRRNRDGSIEVLEKLQNEEQRVEALEKYFKIALKDSERRAIKGWPTELRGP